MGIKEEGEREREGEGKEEGGREGEVVNGKVVNRRLGWGDERTKEIYTRKKKP